MEDGRKVWSKKEVFKFIARYKHYKELWDTRSLDYRNPLCRRKAESKLASEFNTTISEITRKIRILRSQFFLEYKKMYKEDDEDGSSSQSAYITKWAFYQPLQFILASREDDKESLDSLAPGPSLNEGGSKQTDRQSNNSGVDNNDGHKKVAMAPEKRRRINQPSESSSEQSDSSQEPDDEYQIFGNYVASELRSMHYEKNIRELKRFIQEHIVRCTEQDDREYYTA